MQVTHDEVKRLFGDISDHMIVEIINSGATVAELTEVAAHLAQETDVMGELERPLTGRALQLFTMLRAVDDLWQEDR
jgi:urease gamma subunit